MKSNYSELKLSGVPQADMTSDTRSFHLLIFLNTRLQRLQADFLRQHNQLTITNTAVYCTEIVLLAYVSFFTFVKFLNFFSRLL